MSNGAELKFGCFTLRNGVFEVPQNRSQRPRRGSLSRANRCIQTVGITVEKNRSQDNSPPQRIRYKKRRYILHGNLQLLGQQSHQQLENNNEAVESDLIKNIKQRIDQFLRTAVAPKDPNRILACQAKTRENEGMAVQLDLIFIYLFGRGPYSKSRLLIRCNRYIISFKGVLLGFVAVEKTVESLLFVAVVREVGFDCLLAVETHRHYLS